MNAARPKLFERLSKFKTQSEATTEVVPDSEEERQRQETKEPNYGHPAKFIGVIDISSDESGDEARVNLDLSGPSQASKKTPRKAGTRSHYSQARVIESSDEDSGPEIIELSDSSSDDVFANPQRITLKVALEPQVDSEPRFEVDESILIFDEPRNARTPLRLGANRNTKRPSSITADGAPHSSSGGESTANSGASLLTTGPSNHKILTPQPRAKKPQVTPRANSKKAMLAAELTRRHEYAQQLFYDLNTLIFKQGLPQDTKLNWNKRLLTTAGRAKFHQSREGVQTTEIELAEKILDCDERIRNTLSHEMCHLATWVIDNKIDEHHGKLFKNWASRVMKKRPDIHVSIKHDYEISHPFQWKCEKCAKVYGRFSNSIRPDECVCGACKEGTLVPLFPTKASINPNTKKLSRMAAARPQDSPCAMPDSNTPSKSNLCGSESDVEDFEMGSLTKTLASTSIQ
ncbi:hypothetical protein GALMADRAFT_234003 [Galerina marginata CBS 339.88]|uniref:SprT-like domain-containing protein n=1 Tax=Galerina marginata (strain CBS 339.88) TaxID=685588 RepID=A0A067TZ07_GALM3|nr:hypothetical protein GALMADRAFT_234003 [Galerina marginata CBS 339.88]